MAKNGTGELHGYEAGCMGRRGMKTRQRRGGIVVVVVVFVVAISFTMHPAHTLLPHPLCSLPIITQQWFQKTQFDHTFRDEAVGVDVSVYDKGSDNGGGGI